MMLNFTLTTIFTQVLIKVFLVAAVLPRLLSWQTDASAYLAVDMSALSRSFVLQFVVLSVICTL